VITNKHRCLLDTLAVSGLLVITPTKAKTLMPGGLLVITPTKAKNKSEIVIRKSEIKRWIY